MYVLELEMQRFGKVDELTGRRVSRMLVSKGTGKRAIKAVNHVLEIPFKKEDS